MCRRVKLTRGRFGRPYEGRDCGARLDNQNDGHLLAWRSVRTCADPRHRPHGHHSSGPTEERRVLPRRRERDLRHPLRPLCSGGLRLILARSPTGAPPQHLPLQEQARVGKVRNPPFACVLPASLR